MGKSKARNHRTAARAVHAPSHPPAPAPTNTYGMTKAQFELFESSKVRLGLPENFTPSDITRAQFEASKALLGFPEGFDPSALFNLPSMGGAGGNMLDLDGDPPAWLKEGILGIDAAQMLTGRGDPKVAMAEGYVAGRAAGLAAGLAGKGPPNGQIANGKKPATNGSVPMTSAAAGLMGMSLGLAGAPHGTADGQIVPVSDKALSMLNQMLGSRGMMQRDPATGVIDVLLNADHFPNVPHTGQAPTKRDSAVNDIRDIFQTLTDSARKGLGEGSLPSLEDLLKLPIFSDESVQQGPVSMRAESFPVNGSGHANGKAPQRAYVHTATIDIPIPLPPNFPLNSTGSVPNGAAMPAQMQNGSHSGLAPNGSRSGQANTGAGQGTMAPSHPEDDSESHLDEFDLDLNEEEEEEEYDEEDYETDEEEYEDAEDEEEYEDEAEADEAIRRRQEEYEQARLHAQLGPDDPDRSILDDPERLNWAVSELFAWIKWSVDQQIVKPARQARQAREEAAAIAQERAVFLAAQSRVEQEALANYNRRRALHEQAQGQKTGSEGPPSRKKKKRS